MSYRAAAFPGDLMPRFSTIHHPLAAFLACLLVAGVLAPGSVVPSAGAASPTEDAVVERAMRVDLERPEVAEVTASVAPAAMHHHRPTASTPVDWRLGRPVVNPVGGINIDNGNGNGNGNGAISDDASATVTTNDDLSNESDGADTNDEAGSANDRNGSTNGSTDDSSGGAERTGPGPGPGPADGHTHGPQTDSLRAGGRDRDPFVMLGLRMDRPSTETEPVLIRVHDEAGWTDWMELPASHGPDPGTQEGSGPLWYVSEPIWVGAADGYQLNLPPTLRTATIDALLVRETDEVVGLDPRVAQPTAPEITGADSGRSPPFIRSRSSWGARPYKGTPQVASRLDLGLVHHSVNTNDYTSAQVPSMLRAMQAYHQDGNGWYDIAYNFVVDRFGTIWEARAGGIDRAVIGGHARGFNTGSTGVVALGEFSSASPPHAMQRALGELLGWKLFVHGVNPDGRTDITSLGNETFPPGRVVNLPRISGHRDTGATACPGTQLYAHLGVIRAEAIGAYDRRVGSGSFQDVAVNVAGVYQPLAGDFNGNGHTDIVWYGPGAARDGYWTAVGNGRFTARPLNVSGVYQPLVADFNGDGRDDIFWYGPGAARDSLWLGRADGNFTIRSVNVSGVYTPVVGDFDGDGRADILWYGPGAARDVLWYGTASGSFTPRSINVAGVYEPFVGDFDGDGRDDIFWYGPGAARDALWLGRSRGSFAPRSVNVAGVWQPLVGDFDGDGRDDVFWYGAETDRSALWISGGGGGFHSAAGHHPGAGRIPLVGDYTGGGLDDIVWYQEGSSTSALWRSVGPGQWLTRDLTLDGSYAPFTGTFRSDGRDDIFWYGPGALPDRVWLGAG